MRLYSSLIASVLFLLIGNTVYAQVGDASHCNPDGDVKAYVNCIDAARFEAIAAMQRAAGEEEYTVRSTYGRSEYNEDGEIYTDIYYGDDRYERQEAYVRYEANADGEQQLTAYIFANEDHAVSEDADWDVCQYSIDWENFDADWDWDNAPCKQRISLTNNDDVYIWFMSVDGEWVPQIWSRDPDTTDEEYTQIYQAQADATGIDLVYNYGDTVSFHYTGRDYCVTIHEQHETSGLWSEREVCR